MLLGMCTKQILYVLICPRLGQEGVYEATVSVCRRRGVVVGVQQGGAS